MERITILANRLAEAILFDWDKEEVFKLAKEVAVACHENIEFISLVRGMREAQEIANRAMAEADDYSEALIYVNKANELEKEVDEYLEKMEV